jgi:hypothetical protein
MIKIYLFICFLYNRFFTYFENLFLFNPSKQKEITNLSKKGFEIIKIKDDLILKNPEKVFKSNTFMSKDILKYDDIFEFIDLLFNKINLKNIITNKTGYEYSVDFIISYTTFNIPDLEQYKEIYANHWHTDKPFSKNTLKIIIPLNESLNYNGGIKIFDLLQTKNIKKKISFFDKEEYFNMESKINNILFFLPNICFHKAGIAQSVEGRKQIMLQLNPSTRWSVNKNLYEKQFKLEPKFPFFSYLFDKKKLL